MPLTLRKRPDSKYWYLRGTIRGCHVEETTGTADRAAAEEILIKRGNQILYDSIHGRAFSATFLEVANRYEEDRKISRDQARYVDYLVAQFGDLAIGEINHRAVLRCIEAYASQGGPHRPDTIRRNLLGPLQAVLRYAERIVPDYRAPRISAFYDMPASQGRVVRRSPTEMEGFINACSEKLRPWVVFRIYTGWRGKEATDLFWEDVNLETRIAVARDTKNGESRITHLAETAWLALANLTGERHGRVFGYRDRFQPLEDWHAACRTVGWEDFRPHDICHVWASWMRDGGADVTALMATGRWKDMKSALRYVHAPSEETKERLERLPKVRVG